MNRYLMVGMALSVLMGCASNGSKYRATLVSGRQLDKLEYTSFSQLEAELRKKKLEEADYKLEQEMLPKGGKLYLFDKSHYEKHQIVSVIAFDGNRTFKCDDADVSRTVVAPSGISPEQLALRAMGVSYDKSETEIQCDITHKLNPPIQFLVINTNEDTVARYEFRPGAP